jgi:hypothetical protein
MTVRDPAPVYGRTRDGASVAWFPKLCPGVFDGVQLRTGI